MLITETHLRILEGLKRGLTVEAHDKECQQKIYFDSKSQQFKHELDEWNEGERAEILETPEQVFEAIRSARSWAHPNQEAMLEDILNHMQ